VDNLICLRDLAPDLPIIPVLQGWTVADYLRCADLYDHRGINLAAEPLVGLGSVCRRPATLPLPAGISLLPLCAGVSIVYKSIRCHQMRSVPREATVIFVMIVAGMVLAAAALSVMVKLMM